MFDQLRRASVAHWKRIAALAAVLLVTAVVLLGSHLPKQEELQFITAPVQRADIEQTVLATGVLQAIRQVDVGAQVNGQLKALHVSLGQQVRKGDLLAEIDPVLAENTLRQSQAALNSLLAQKRAREVRLHQAQLVLKRQNEMLASEATSTQEVESAEAEVSALSADVAALQAQIQQQRLSVDSAQANLSYNRIIAPIDGEVVEINTLEGQTVVASYQVPTILTLADLSTMTVKAQISEADVVRTRVGQKVYFTILGDPDKRYEGTLRAILPSPEKINNAIFFHALFDVPNPERRLRVDMTAQVFILLNKARNVLTIPLTALGPPADKGFGSVRVLHPDQQVEIRKIRIGISDAAQVQVLSGLSEHERVVIGDAGAAPHGFGGGAPQ